MSWRGPSPLARSNLIPVQRLLLEGEKQLRLGSRALEVLIALVERHNELVTKEELMARVWPNVFVESSNLTVHIAALRECWAMDVTAIAIWSIFQDAAIRFVAPVSTADREMPWSTQPSGPAVHPDIFGVHGFRRAVSKARNCWRVRKPRIRPKLRRRAAMIASGALVAGLRRCANRAFFSIDGVFTVMTPLLPNQLVANAAC